METSFKFLFIVFQRLRLCGNNCCIWFLSCADSFFSRDFSFADLQKPQMELDGKACAGVGQSSLMAYYETMFDQVMLLFYFLAVS